LNLITSSKKNDVIIGLNNLSRPRLTIFEKIVKSDKKDVDLFKANSFLDNIKIFLHGVNTDQINSGNKCMDIQYTGIGSNLQRSRLLSL
jgi:hypothetical protein